MAAYSSESSSSSTPDARPVIGCLQLAPMAVGGRRPPPFSFSAGSGGGGKSSHTLSTRRADSRSVMAQDNGEHVGGVHVLMMQGGGNRRSNTNTSNSPSSGHDARDVKPFIVDSGATVHATGDRTVLSNLQATRTTRSLRMANGSFAGIRGWGTVRHHNITLHGVLYVPELAHNIVSVSKLGELDYIVEFTRAGCFIREAGTGDLVGRGHLVNGLFELDFLEAPRT